MKHWISFAVAGAAILAVLVYRQMRRFQVSVSPAPVLYFIAGSEQELTPLPVSFAHLSDADEINIGNHLARAYIEQVGARVGAHAHRKLPFRFHYIPEIDFINAFALPGGHVYIGAGPIALMDSEDELAAVLGHEIEHIDHYHCGERVETEEALRHIPLGALAAIPVEIFEVGYSKGQELEADREGTRLAVLAGYSPLGAIRIFETLDRLEHVRTSRAQSPQQELSGVARQTVEGYFRSHPAPSERIAQIKRTITEENWMNLTAERKLAVESIFLTARVAARHPR